MMGELEIIHQKISGGDLKWEIRQAFTQAEILRMAWYLGHGASGKKWSFFKELRKGIDECMESKEIWPKELKNIFDKV